jgi:hypothetical protein
VSKLFKSRKFLTALVDVVLSLALYFVSKYAAPGVAEDVKFLIGAIQPVFLLVIGMIAVEDAAAYKAGVHPRQGYPADEQRVG